MKIKLNEKLENVLTISLFYLLLIVLTLALVHRADNLEQQKSADITAQMTNVNN